MQITTITNEKIDVDPRDIAYVGSNGATVIRTLTGSGQHSVRLTDESAAQARAAIAPRFQPATIRTEQQLFAVAASCGALRTLDEVVPGTTVPHKVDVVVMDASDIGAFAAALGVPVLPVPDRDPVMRNRRQSDRRHAEGGRRQFDNLVPLHALNLTDE